MLTWHVLKIKVLLTGQEGNDLMYKLQEIKPITGICSCSIQHSTDMRQGKVIQITDLLKFYFSYHSHYKKLEIFVTFSCLTIEESRTARYTK